jgi:hypothetical protein
LGAPQILGSEYFLSYRDSNPSVVQPVASRYTDCATAPSEKGNISKIMNNQIVFQLNNVTRENSKVGRSGGFNREATDVVNQHPLRSGTVSCKSS